MRDLIGKKVRFKMSTENEYDGKVFKKIANEDDTVVFWCVELLEGQSYVVVKDEDILKVKKVT